jgi:hypothetical protein
MADTNINTAAYGSLDHHSTGAPRWVVSTAPGVAYAFTVNSSEELVYHKYTTAGGWGSAQNIYTSGDVERFDIYYDKWTKNVTTDKIHIVWQESTTDTVLHNSLDVSDDSLDGQNTIYSATSVGTIDNLAYGQISIVRAEGGNLYVWAQTDATPEYIFYRSTDGGSNWTSRATSGLWETGGDRIQLQPGNETDTNDIYCLYIDIVTGGNSIFTLKTYDNSANSWSESSAIVSDIYQWSTGIGGVLNGAQRHSDGHIIAVLLNSSDLSTSDFRVYDITNGSTWSTLTEPISNTDDWHYPTIMINQNNDDLYACYVGKEDGTEVINASVNTYYMKSTDDGSTWDSAGTKVSETQDDHRISSCPPSVGSDGGDLVLVWFNDDLNNLVSNIGNMVSITVEVDTDDSQGAYLKGSVDSSDSADAYTHGQDSTSGAQEAYTAGQDDEIDSQSAFLQGSQDTTDSAEAFTHGQDTETDSVEAFLAGGIVSTDSQEAYLKGQDTASDSVPAFMSTESSALDNIPAYTKGLDTDVDSLEAYLAGGIITQDNLEAYLKGQDVEADNIEAYTHGQLHVVESVEAFTKGGSDITTSIGAFLAGGIVSTDNVPAYTAGQDTATDSLEAFAQGSLDTSDSVEAYMLGALGASASVDAYTKGQDTATDSTPAMVVSTTDTTDSVSAFCAGEVGDAVVAVATVNCKGSTGTQDITANGLGTRTPKAAILITSRADVDGTKDDQISRLVAITDGTTHRSGCYSFDGSDEGTVTHNTRIAGIVDRYTWDGYATFDSWITGGIRIDWDDATSDDWTLTVIFFAGDDVSVDILQMNATTANSSYTEVLGFIPSLVFSMHDTGNLSPGSSSSARQCLGFGVNNDHVGGAPPQACVSHKMDMYANSDAEVYVSDSYFAVDLGLSGDPKFTLDEFTGDGFKWSVSGAYYSDFHCLAVDLAGKEVHVSTEDTPTSTGSWAVDAPGFQPEFVMMLMSFAQATDTAYTTADAGAVGISTFDENEERSTAIEFEVGVASPNDKTLVNSEIIDMDQDDGTTGFDGTLTSIDNDGFTANLTNTMTGAARYWPLLAIGQQPSASSSIHAYVHAGYGYVNDSIHAYTFAGLGNSSKGAYIEGATIWPFTDNFTDDDGDPWDISKWYTEEY